MSQIYIYWRVKLLYDEHGKCLICLVIYTPCFLICKCGIYHVCHILILLLSSSHRGMKLILVGGLPLDSLAKKVDSLHYICRIPSQKVDSLYYISRIPSFILRCLVGVFLHTIKFGIGLLMSVSLIHSRNNRLNCPGLPGLLNLTGSYRIYYVLKIKVRSPFSILFLKVQFAKEKSLTITNIL